MTRQPLVAHRAEELLGVAVVATAPIAGGDVAMATKLRLSDGTTALIKTMPHAPTGLFAAEAAGLRWLAESGGVTAAEVLAAESDCLILRWVEPGKPTLDAAVTFGQQLAATHRAGAPSYGLERDGYIGRLPLPNKPMETWAEFYAARRVLPYLRHARDHGGLTTVQAEAIEGVLGRLAELVPDEPPSRLHGDLWNGNVIWGHDGSAHVVDPAAYGGHREVDVAMLSLFGLSNLPKVLDAYDDAHPLADGWEDRLGLHQLHPLLVHACLFGGGYGTRAAEIAVHFA